MPHLTPHNHPSPTLHSGIRRHFIHSLLLLTGWLMVISSNALAQEPVEKNPGYPKSQQRALKIIHAALSKLENSENLPNRTKTDPLEFQKSVLAQIRNKKFADLDKKLDEVAKKKQHSLNDRYFYQEVIEAISRQYRLTENFKLWRETTGSAHAYGLSANHHVDLAWKARGDDFADDVPPDGWKPFGEHLRIAEGFAKKALKIDPANPSALGVRITIGMATDTEPEDIEKFYLEAIKHHPTNGKYFEMAAYACTPRWSGDTKKYQDFIEKNAPNAVVDSSSMWAVAFFLGEASKWIRRDPVLNVTGEEIVGANKRIVELWITFAPNRRTFHEDFGWRLHDNGCYYLAANIGMEGTERSPKKASFHRLLGQSLYFMNREQFAVPSLEMAAKLEPDHHWGWYYLGSCYHILKQWEKCFNAHKRSVKQMEPSQTSELAWAYYQASDSAYHLGKLKEAKELGEKSLEKDGARHCGRVVLVLAQVAVDQKDKAAARKILENGLKENPRLSRLILKTFPEWEKW